MHYVSWMSVSNFKLIKKESFSFQSYTPIVGYNNAGKSNIIFALKWLLNKQVLDSRFFNDIELPIEVKGHIKGVSEKILGLLNENHRKRIENYVNNEIIKIKRIQADPNTKSNQINISIWNPETKEWDINPTGIDSAIKHMFPDVIELEAMTDAAEDIAKQKTSNTIGKIVAELLTTVTQNHSDDVDRVLDGIRKKFDADGDERVTELREFDSDVTEKLQVIFPGIKVKLHVPTPEMRDIFKSATIKLFENNIGRDLIDFGHGTQRAVQMALIRQLAEVKSSAGETGATVLLLIDEPELYLHPQAIEQIRASLKTLSKYGYQVVFSTHSPQMIPAEDIKHTLLIKKNEKGTRARKTILQAVKNVAKGHSSQYQLLFSLENANQILFSESVILTEGRTEKRLLPIIYKIHHNKTFGQSKIALVSQGGVDNTVKAMNVLRAMEIPCKAIVDLDFAFRGAINEGLIDSENPNIVACKGLLAMQGNGIKIDHNGLPTKNGSKTPAEAFEWLAKQDKAISHIEELHRMLLDKNIWLWTLGAIEPYIDISGKNEHAWSSFRQRVEDRGLDALVSERDFYKMLDWISS